MYELDHMLNGNGSSQHHHNMIREAQHEKFARDVQSAAPDHSKAFSPLRAILVVIINRIVR